MEELMKIQSELKAPKGQYNSFGRYKYRSCEDILEAVKPLLLKYGCTLTITDDIIPVEASVKELKPNMDIVTFIRVYVKATCTLTNKDGKTVTVNGFAREADTKAGMDVSQITGAASSYARKYALNGLFCIDDTKDSDTNELRQQSTAATQRQQSKAAQQQTDPETLAIAIQEVRAAQTRASLTEIYKRYKMLHTDDKFLNAVKETGKKFPK